MKPIIGIAGHTLTTEDNHLLDFDIQRAAKPLADIFTHLDTLPIIIPLSKPKDAEQYIKQIDALVLTGGDDVNPLLYSQEPSIKIGKIDPNRDLFEIELIKEAWKQRKPILGICRGMQLLNVSFGGTLYQDLSENSETKFNHAQSTPWKYATHSINIESDSSLKNIFDQETVVNSYHHQAINDIADVFKPIAQSKDGVIEAIESIDNKQKTIAIQWHPEILIETTPKQIEIFKYFIDLISK